MQVQRGSINARRGRSAHERGQQGPCLRQQVVAVEDEAEVLQDVHQDDSKIHTGPSVMRGAHDRKMQAAGIHYKCGRPHQSAANSVRVVQLRKIMHLHPGDPAWQVRDVEASDEHHRQHEHARQCLRQHTEALCQIALVRQDSCSSVECSGSPKPLDLPVKAVAFRRSRSAS